MIGVADTIRETSREAIVQLHQLGIRTVMLTGDNAVIAMAIAQQVGIDGAQGNMLPEDKLSAINDEVARFGTVGMVGMASMTLQRWPRPTSDSPWAQPVPTQPSKRRTSH